MVTLMNPDLKSAAPDDNSCKCIGKNECIGRDISHLFRSINIYLSNELEAYGLGSGQFPFFMRLLHQDGVSQESLANMLRYDRATITRSLNKLEDQGYVIRKRDPKDKRAYCVYLTEEGQKMGPILMEIGANLNNVLLQGFSDEDKVMFISLVEKAAMNIATENEIKKASND
ncbi:MarR family transcriptional regulator [Methanolobus vulcani]|uniref:MarR family transcriptional regulator n=2 Tax=Methanolobus vulcani TaxID=38026 RepID=A0A7Z8P340_9EURY|nr:MarR family transcriptional regulator [Methanolobus vulcani]